MFWKNVGSRPKKLLTKCLNPKKYPHELFRKKKGNLKNGFKLNNKTFKKQKKSLRKLGYIHLIIYKELKEIFYLDKNLTKKSIKVFLKMKS